MNTGEYTTSMINSIAFLLHENSIAFLLHEIITRLIIFTKDWHACMGSPQPCFDDNYFSILSLVHQKVMYTTEYDLTKFQIQHHAQYCCHNPYRTYDVPTVRKTYPNFHILITDSAAPKCTHVSHSGVLVKNNSVNFKPEQRGRILFPQI
jgi:hypothetical protein